MTTDPASSARDAGQDARDPQEQDAGHGVGTEDATQEGGAVSGYGSDSGFTEGAEALPEDERPA